MPEYQAPKRLVAFFENTFETTRRRITTLNASGQRLAGSTHGALVTMNLPKMR